MLVDWFFLYKLHVGLIGSCWFDHEGAELMEVLLAYLLKTTIDCLIGLGVVQVVYCYIALEFDKVLFLKSFIGFEEGLLMNLLA